MKKYLLGFVFILSAAIGISFNVYAQHDSGGYGHAIPVVAVA